MADIKLQIQDINGAIIKDQILHLTNQDNLVLKVNQPMTPDMQKIIQDILKGLSQNKILVLPDFIDLKILKVIK